MKRLFALVGLALALWAWEARAQNPDEQYVRIYSVLQQADILNNSDQPAQALPKYLEAQSALQKFQKQFPLWNNKIVNFRLNYLAGKIEATSAKAPAVAAALIGTNATARPALTTPPVAQPEAAPPTVAAESERQLAILQNDVRLLQTEKALLQAKLKEALGTQPAAVDPRELAKAQEKVQSLLRENDLLKVSLAQEQAKPVTGADPKVLDETRRALAEANRKLAQQTERAATLASEKQSIQEQFNTLKATEKDAASLAATKQALEEANRKLAEQTEATGRLTLERSSLQSRVRSMTASVEAAEALRAENDLLKKQVADLKAAAPNAPASENAAAQLAQAQARIASLQSDAEILRLEKIALQSRVKQMAIAPVTTTVIPPPGRTEDLERMKSLERERDDLQKKLEAANRELYGRNSREIAARVDQLTGEITTLRARLEVFEARAAPYSTEELALFKQSDRKLAAADPNAGKASVKELPPKTTELVAQAQRHFSAREYDKAEEKYLEILRQDEKNVYTLANLAAIQLELNHLDEAEKHVKQALAVAPEDAYSLSILGYLKFRQEKYDEALNALSRAAKLNPSSAEIQNYLGVTLSHKGMRGPAETALRKAIQLDPGYASAHNNLAVIYLAQNPPLIELGRWHYQKALDAGHPRNPELEKMLEKKSSGEGK